MMRRHYVIDKDFGLRKATRSIRHIVLNVAKWLVATASLAALYYVVGSLFVNTEVEKRLKSENAMYGKLYPEMLRKRNLVRDVVEDLQNRDNAIYETVFHAEAPAADPNGDIVMNYSQDGAEVPDKDIVLFASGKLDAAEKSSRKIEDNFKAIFGALASHCGLPPMTTPIKNLTYTQIGASTGSKVNPFYKVESVHTGLDLIAGQGEEVCATADAVVESVTHSSKGSGNVVTLDFGNGYTGRFAHLSDIAVRKGQSVKKGQRIGYVGISGNSFAPHLHYELDKDGTPVDPVNYMFATLSPSEYFNAAYMSAATGQSLD